MNEWGKGTGGETISGADLVKNRDAISKLAQSSDAQRLMQLLKQGGGVEDAAQKAAAGDAGELIARMKKLMNTQEGAQLVERISKQAKESGFGK